MIREIGKEDIERALDLVNRVFAQYVAVDYTEQGRKTFADYLETKLDEVCADVVSGRKRMWGYYAETKIVGVIATRDVCHISLLFVDGDHHKRGIARALFETVMTEIQKQTGMPGIAKMTVNSSPYVVEAYRRLGFLPTAPQQEKNGILYVPMEYTIDQ